MRMIREVEEVALQVALQVAIVRIRPSERSGASVAKRPWPSRPRLTSYRQMIEEDKVAEERKGKEQGEMTARKGAKNEWKWRVISQPRR